MNGNQIHWSDYFFCIVNEEGAVGMIVILISCCFHVHSRP